MLTEAAFLRAQRTPSDRGNLLDELLLCGGSTPHLPPALPPPQLGTRYDAYAALAALPQCASCHGRIDGIGLALEQFDEAGRYRPEEAGQPVTPIGRE